MAKQTTKTENEFIEKVNSVYKNCVGYEKFGQTTEFYDEDGAILMKAEEDLDGQITFEFSGSENLFKYEEIDTEENEDDE